jgi:hypothetical protein
VSDGDGVLVTPSIHEFRQSHLSGLLPNLGLQGVFTVLAWSGRNTIKVYFAFILHLR